MTYICVLISSDSDELSLWEDEGLSFGWKEGILRAVLLNLHDVKTRLVFVEWLEHDHLERRHRSGQGRWHLISGKVMWFLIFRITAFIWQQTVENQTGNVRAERENKAPWLDSNRGCCKHIVGTIGHFPTVTPNNVVHFTLAFVRNMMRKMIAFYLCTF